MYCEGGCNQAELMWRVPWNRAEDFLGIPSYCGVLGFCFGVRILDGFRFLAGCRELGGKR